MTATVTDNLTDLLAAWEENPQCDHTDHNTLTHIHQGDAEWETTHVCRKCKTTANGLRCNGWYKWCATARGQVYCTTCNTTQTTYDYFRDTHWRKL